MPYIPMTEYDGATEDVRTRYDDQIAKHGRITNMKRTLLHSIKAFDAYMEWYPLCDLLEEFLPHRTVMLYAYAISEGNRCLVCGAFFRKILIDAGDDPDAPVLSTQENLLMELGFSISEDPHNIDPDIYAVLREQYNEKQLTLLFAFAGIMTATNLFNTIAQVPLDEVLYNYRKTQVTE
ncbi:MAG: hypothetical protein LBC83_05035 [Oscillospiraceae bacterium]|jgi:alkylhydroperoxidase family enzyme|nr:hypothetical protein [Oscillospiraceae bacterium]